MKPRMTQRKRATRPVGVVAMLAACCLLGGLFTHEQLAVAAEPLSWPQMGGPEGNRISRETRISLDWRSAVRLGLEEPIDPAAMQNDAPVETASESSKPELWRIADLSGRGDPLVFNDKLYLIETVNSADESADEQLTTSYIDCWYVSDRDEEAKFRYQLPEYKSVHSEQRTPLLVGDPAWRQLFCLTPDGKLLCLDSDLGNLLWSKSLSELVELPAATIICGSPTVFEQFVFVPVGWQEVSPGQQTVYLLAIDRRNGQISWHLRKDFNSNERLKIVMPALGVYNQQVVLITQLEPGRVELLQVRTGQPVAKMELHDPAAMAIELLYESGQLAVLSKTAGGNVGGEKPSWHCELFELADKSRDEQQREIKPGTLISPTRKADWSIGQFAHVTCLLKQGMVCFATSAGTLISAHTATPDLQSSRELMSPGPHYLQWVNGQLLVTGESGSWEVFVRVDQQPNQPQQEPIRPADSTNDGKQISWRRIYAEQWEGAIVAAPAIVKQRFYVRQPDELVALGPFENRSSVSDFLPVYVDIAQESTDGPATWLHVIPSLQTLLPGREIQLQVLKYNTQGVYLGVAEPATLNWSWQGPGQLDEQLGRLVLPETLEDDFASELTVTSGELSGRATLKGRKPISPVKSAAP